MKTGWTKTGRTAGETGWQVQDRMRERQSDISNAKPVSKVYGHVNSKVYDQNVRILDASHHVKIRLQSESIQSSMKKSDEKVRVRL